MSMRNVMREGVKPLATGRLVGLMALSSFPTVAFAGESDPPADIRVSAKTGENIPALRERMFSLCMEGYSADGFLIEERHYAAVRRALAELNEALAVCGKVPPDLLGVHLKAAWDALGEISGETANERIIDEIFSKFCVGK